MFSNNTNTTPLFGANAGQANNQNNIFGKSSGTPVGGTGLNFGGAGTTGGAGSNTPNLFGNLQTGGGNNPLFNKPSFGNQPTGQPQANPLFGGQGQGIGGAGQTGNPMGQPQPQPQMNMMGMMGPPNQQQNPLGQTQNQFGGQAGGNMFAGNTAKNQQNTNITGQKPPENTLNQQTGNQSGAPMFGGLQQQQQPPNVMQNQPGDPSKNLQQGGDQQKSNLQFGAEIHKKGSPSKDSQTIMSQAISQHMTIEELFRKWKKELEDQVNDFLKLGRDLNKDEKDLYDMHNMLFNLNSNLKQLESDYGHIQTSLGGLERQQDDLITRLNQIEGELGKALPQDNEDAHLKSSANLLNKAKELNKETLLIEGQVQGLVDEVNQPLKEYNEDVNKILNSYYESLEYIELDTLAIQTKLNNFEAIVEKHGIK